jgi:hypothetical protein
VPGRSSTFHPSAKREGGLLGLPISPFPDDDRMTPPPLHQQALRCRFVIATTEFADDLRCQSFRVHGATLLQFANFTL